MSAAPILTRVLQLGAILAGAIAIVGAVVGLFVDGPRGLVSGLIGAALAFVFQGVTAATILVAARLTKGDFLNPIFFVIVLGGWILKFVVFIIVALLLRDQDWINTVVLFLALVVSVIGSLAIDVIVIWRSRMPYVSDIRLPERPDTD